MSLDEVRKFDNLVEALLLMRTRQQMENFLRGILTEDELHSIPQRLEIVKLLKKGVTHQTIAENLSVGVATVTRGSKEIQKGRFKYV